MSALTCRGPRSRSISFIAVKSGRSGQPVHRPDGPRGHCACERRRGQQRLLAHRSRRTGRRRRCGRRAKHVRPVPREERFEPLAHHGAGVLAGARERPLADHLGRKRRLAKQQADRLLEVFRLTFLDDEQRPLAGGEIRKLRRDERVGDVEDVQRHARRPEDIREAEPFECTQRGVVEPALQHDAEVVDVAVVPLVEPVRCDELDGGRPAPIDLLALLLVGRRREDDPVVAAPRRGERIRHGERRPSVVARDEPAVHVAGADPQHQHHRRAAGLGELEPALDQPHDGRQVRAWIEQPHLGLHREGVGALLHDAGALAVVLAQHDQRAAGDAGGREIRQGIRGHVGADRGLPGDRSADRVVDGRGEHRRRGRLARARLEAHAQLVEDAAGVREHIHQVRHRRALVAADVCDARLQQRLGDREDGLTLEGLARTETEGFDFPGEGSFRHAPPAGSPENS